MGWARILSLLREGRPVKDSLGYSPRESLEPFHVLDFVHNPLLESYQNSKVLYLLIGTFSVYSPFPLACNSIRIPILGKGFRLWEILKLLYFLVSATRMFADMRRLEMKQPNPLAVRISPEVKAELKTVANQYGTTVNRICTDAIAEKLQTLKSDLVPQKP